MNSIITLFIIAANVIAILLVYFSLEKNMDKQRKIITIMASIGSVYIITLVVYLLSSIGVEKIAAAETVRNAIIMAFVPVNVILFLPFLIRSFKKMQSKIITMESLNRRVIVVAILAVIVLIAEGSYFRNYQKKLKELERNVSSNQEAQAENLTNETNEQDINGVNIVNEVINTLD